MMTENRTIPGQWDTLFAAGNPVRCLHTMVGRTPLIELRVRYRGCRLRVFAKYEALNLTGSIKDRMAVHILGRAYEQGRIKPGDEIVEASSGNTAISFAAVGRAIGHPVRIFMPDWMSQERVQIVRSLGAELVSVTAEEGGFLGSISMAHELAEASDHIFEPLQFSNAWNVEAHETCTGPEIIEQLAAVDLTPAAFVAGVGTGGTVMGVGRALRRAFPEFRIHPLEPAESPILTARRKTGSHRIQGISDEFIPEIVDLDALDPVVSVHDGDAILMAQALSRGLGLGVGISSGANVVGAIKIARELPEDAVVITVFADSNKKYLSTDLFGEEPVREEYLTPHVQLDGFCAIPAVA